MGKHAVIKHPLAPSYRSTELIQWTITDVTALDVWTYKEGRKQGRKKGINFTILLCNFIDVSKKTVHYIGSYYYCSCEGGCHRSRLTLDHQSTK